MRLSKILERSEKKINVGCFFGEEDEKEYITIKKLPYNIKKKLQFLAMNTMSGQTSKMILKEMKKRGLKAADIDNLSEEEQIEIMMELKVDQGASESIANMTLETTKYTIDYGVDPKKHTLYDENDNLVELNYDLISRLGNTYLIEYLVKEIKNFSEGYALGKPSAKELEQ
jgi:hypothetical protein